MSMSFFQKKTLFGGLSRVFAHFMCYIFHLQLTLKADVVGRRRMSPSIH